LRDGCFGVRVRGGIANGEDELKHVLFVFRLSVGFSLSSVGKEGKERTGERTSNNAPIRSSFLASPALT
jgi:hypothetical protein